MIGYCKRCGEWIRALSNGGIFRRGETVVVPERLVYALAVHGSRANRCKGSGTVLPIEQLAALAPNYDARSLR